MSRERELRVTVCQLRSEPELLATDWERLVSHVRETKSDFVLLPEMPFYPFPFWRQAFTPDIWQEAVTAHDSWQERLAELPAEVVAGSRPVTVQNRRFNQGFLWHSSLDDVKPTHIKYFLPDEAGFWEASWYERGDGSFEPVEVQFSETGTACLGFLICTELWFMQKARRYGQNGAHLLLTPRATEKRTVDKWLAGGRAAAVIAGAYSLSSNHYADAEAPIPLGGLGWVIGPDGEVLALTTADNPFVTVSIDLRDAERAKHTYPRYVPD